MDAPRETNQGCEVWRHVDVQELRREGSRGEDVQKSGESPPLQQNFPPEK